jgi:SAM-dependent methyltransferase
MAIAPNSLGSYSQLAGEYYDSRLHPTCANFREASEAILKAWFSAFLRAGVSILETGSGASLTSELRDRMNLKATLILSDQSPEMLRQTKWRVGDYRVILDAERISVRGGSMDAIVASLGDPYNTGSFWRECARVLRPGGRVFFTTPSSDWAFSFREETGAPKTAAAFDLAHGETLLVPSFVLAQPLQRDLIRCAGLEVEETVQVDASAIRHTSPSPKLRSCPLVTGYRVILPAC